MKVGIIGYGQRLTKVVKEVLRVAPDCTIGAILDHRKEEIRTLLGADAEGIQFVDTVEQLLNVKGLTGLLLGTRDNTHVHFGKQILPAGLPIFFEKPVATTLEDLYSLREAYYASNNSQVLVSFPIRMSPMVQFVKELINSDKIGSVEHVQAINNVTYGGNFFHRWYRDESLTGGLFLTKGTHDIDSINYLVGLDPVMACAMASKQVFKGNKPAGLICTDCDEQNTCEESMAHMGPESSFRWCAFAEDTGNQDSGTAIIRYSTGMHAVYSQNFIVRRGAGGRGARLIGYKGTIEYDLKTKQIQVFMHHTARTETYSIEPEGSHFGGDIPLAKNFVSMMRGEAAPLATMEEGLRSALTCLKIKDSASTNTFQSIGWDV